MYAVVFDGSADQELVNTCEMTGIAIVASMNAQGKGTKTKVMTAEDLL